MRIATWNINSVRLRINLATRFLREHQPDVLITDLGLPGTDNAFGTGEVHLPDPPTAAPAKVTPASDDAATLRKKPART